MKLFDDVIKEVRALLPDLPDKAEYFEERLCAESGDKNALLFRSDTAFELGGSGKHAVESTMFTSFSEPEDEVLLFGKDLEEITEDVSFAHLTFIQLKEQSEENLHYEQLKNIGFSVFQLYPKGYHIRISPSAGREQVKVSKEALKRNPPLSFMNIGCSLIRLLKTQNDVAYVKTVFITCPDVDYPALAALARKAKRITDAVQKTLQLDELDCAACKMKPICDEVEGLRELHFQKEKERKPHAT